ncbi:hypothetical protein AVEN_78606-1 [Araneus ventricosus]|uniref:Endonuclease/exonuclease/phosphatase domain-containing protein n=1 Tax=Araneus ventricosus TaxID=182803 RepID=A0A4Y2G3M9_ARAVE|nr:hypothetical protein AVEN_78606-1 [Araneus ventricosus]
MPSSSSSLFRWSFFQGNLGGSQVGTQKLPTLFFSRRLSFAETLPGQREGVRSASQLAHYIRAKFSQVLIAVWNKSISILVRYISDHVVAVDLAVGNDSVTIVSFYFPLHSLRPGLNLLISNDPNSLPTFETERGKSWIDVTLSSQSLYHRKGSWDVHRTTLSDHNSITFSINGVTGAPPPPGHPRLNQRQLFKLAKATEEFFKQIEHELDNIQTKDLIKTKLRASFEEFCSRITKCNPFHLPYKLASKKIHQNLVLCGVKKENGALTSSVEETVQVIIKSFFPKDEENSETAGQKPVRTLVNNYNDPNSAPPFSLWEIQGVANSRPSKKALGPDGVTAEMLNINKRCPRLLLVLLNTCLRLRCFPNSWKNAKLVLLSKPEKEPTLANSYQPICLLSVLSKTLDKLVTQRLTHLLHKKGLLHLRQHGFRVGRSCETANHSLGRD